MNDSAPTYRVRIPTRIDLAGGWSDVPDFADREGGEVLNVAVDRYVEGECRWGDETFDLRTRLNLPPHSHLGSSSSADVAFLALTLALTGRLRTDRAGRIELAEKSFRLERLIGETGGKQDHYASALGGIHRLRFGNQDRPADVETVSLDPPTVEAFQRRLILAESGVRSGSGSIHADVWERYRAGDASIADAVRALRNTVAPAVEALRRGDLDTLGEILDRNRRLSASIDARIEPPEMTRFFDAAYEAGAIGGKICGAGGGGCLIVMSREGAEADVRAALADAGADILDWCVAESVLPEVEAKRS